METAFVTAISALFADPHLSVAARYRAGGRGEGVWVRVMRRRPERVVGFGEGRIVSEAGMFDLPVAAVPALAAGDTFEIAGDRWQVQGTPLADPDRLVWTAEAHPLPRHGG